MPKSTTQHDSRHAEHPDRTERPDRAEHPDRTDRGADRETVAARLLTASERHTLPPDTEVAWGTPWDPDLWFLPPHLVSLYDTPLWREMSPARRRELSRHEAASHAWTLLQGENMLIRMLARHIVPLDPTAQHVRYALTEIEDECRHSKMFARLIGELAVPVHHRSALDRFRTALWQLGAGPVRVFSAALIIEEVLDRFQRAAMADPSVQRVVRDVCRVHVVEESRHIRYARAELERQLASCSRPKRWATRLVCGLSALVVSRRLIPPQVYAEVGLDPRRATREARTSPHRRTTLRWSAARLTAFLTTTGAQGPPGTWAWRRSGFL
ncbi:diiron oxygenase [Streptomyces sp. TRM64462]|uniref:AurF N-oxygenase family protein n=1 Tax=Streptomyces sp. TRM64462 TaxID=2741726 RepID=UPI001586654A|nr:diiron oxygenase [Streptomyces sp. TRM64462]